MTDGASERTFELTRTFDAPMTLVFAALTDADHLEKWWGPEGFGVARATSDARPGGAFTIVMRAPDGSETPVDGTYDEFDPPHHLVATTAAVAPDGTRLLDSTVTIDLAERAGGTELRLRARGVALVPDAVPMLGGMELGWVQSLRCLDDHLTGAADRQLVLMRMLAAPPARVFEVWCAPEHVASWWGPDGFTLTTHEMDVRPGGAWGFTMHGPDGIDVENHIEYEVVEPPSLLRSFHRGALEDDDPPFRTTVTFDDWAGNTVLTMKSVFATAEELDLVLTKFDAAEGGEQMLDRLVAYVATR